MQTTAALQLALRATLLAALLAAPALTHAETGGFSKIADSADELASFSIPALNDAGQVAFVATFDDAALGQTLYRYASGVLTSIADTSGPVASFIGTPAMNASGVVAVKVLLDDGSTSIITGSGGALTTIANTVTDALSSLGDKPAISDPGVVVVLAARNAGAVNVILKGTGSAPVTLLDSSGPYNPQDVAGINEDGVVAFEALDGTGEKGVYRTIDGIVVTPIAATSPGGYTSVEALQINNNDTVVFFAETAAGVGALFVASNAAPVSFADTTSPFNTFGPASVAESSAVAFRGTFDLGLDGIFSGSTGLYEKAIAVGDNLLGSVVTGLDTGPEAAANDGSFVFRARRGDGTSGIYLASPGSIGVGGGGGSSGLDPLSAGVLLVLGVLVRQRRMGVK